VCAQQEGEEQEEVDGELDGMLEDEDLDTPEGGEEEEGFFQSKAMRRTTRQPDATRQPMATFAGSSSDAIEAAGSMRTLPLPTLALGTRAQIEECQCD
jgi:hypothetical protein